MVSWSRPHIPCNKLLQTPILTPPTCASHNTSHTTISQPPTCSSHKTALTTFSQPPTCVIHNTSLPPVLQTPACASHKISTSEMVKTLINYRMYSHLQQIGGESKHLTQLMIPTDHFIIHPAGEILASYAERRCPAHCNPHWTFTHLAT